MTLGDLLTQNLLSVLQGVLTAVLGYIAVRILRGIRASADRTEEHAKETAERVSQLDTVSMSGANRRLEDWQRDIALRVEAVADGGSDSLAWQANSDRRLAALEQFARELDAYAHGSSDLPTYTRPVLTPSEGTADVH